MSIEDIPTYPKVETLYVRDPDTFKVIQGSLRDPVFDVPSMWVIEEKIDGTNVRVHVTAEGKIIFGGRTARAQMPTFLLEYLQRVFTREAFEKAIDSSGAPFTLYGEGFGPKIQGGGGYSTTVGFCLFDVMVGNLWLSRPSVYDIANKLNIIHAPNMGSRLLDEVGVMVRKGFDSHLSVQTSTYGPWGVIEKQAEGVIARTEPLLLDRFGNRLMWKLKTKDFATKRTRTNKK